MFPSSILKKTKLPGTRSGRRANVITLGADFLLTDPGSAFFMQEIELDRAAARRGIVHLDGYRDHADLEIALPHRSHPTKTSGS